MGGPNRNPAMAECSSTQNDDYPADIAVTGTLFSKSWILSLLVKLIESVDGETGPNEQNKAESCPIQPRIQQNEDCDSNTKLNSEASIDNTLNEDLETDLSQLWDLSMISEVSLFLNEHGAVELIIGTLVRSSCHRLSEICVGILNNMTCVDSICAKHFSNISSIDLFVSLLSHSDSGVLTELTRLMITCLSCDKAKQSWLSAFKLSTTALNDITFILQSSTNNDLLKNTSMLLDNLLDQDTELLSNWSNSTDLIQSICEAANQCDSIICTLMLTLQLFTTVENGAASLLSVANEVCSQAVNFLRLFSENFDSCSDEDGRGIAGSLSLVSFLVKNSASKKEILTEHLSNDQTFVRQLKSLADSSCNCNDIDVNNDIIKTAENILSILR